MRAVAYCRVSKDDKKMLNSLDNQKEYFKEEIGKRGYELVSIYADEGLSGKTTLKRTQFNKMLKDTRQNKFDIIFCKQVSRFSRNVEDITRIIKELKRLGIGVIFIIENINTLDSSKEFLINMFASLAQEEARNCSDRVQYGLRQSALKGIWKSHPPYGFKKLNKKLVINETEAEIVKFIYDKYLNNWGVGKITRNLIDKGIPTKANKKGVLWSQITISNILRNPVYIGSIQQHRIEMIDPIAIIQKEVPKDEWIIVEDKSIQIIDNDTFNLVQLEIERRNSLRENKTKHSSATIFSNLLYCQNCKIAMKRKKVNTYKRKDGTRKERYEWCCTYRDLYGKKKCDTLHRTKIYEDSLIEEIKDQFELFNTDTILNDIDEYFKGYLEYKLNDSIKDKLPEIEKEINEIDTMIKNNLKMFSKGIINEDQFTEIAQEENARREVLTKEKHKIENIKEESELIKLKYLDLKKYVADIDVDNLDNHTLKKIFKKIYITRDPWLMSDENSKDGQIYHIEYNFGIDFSRDDWWAWKKGKQI